MIYAIVQKIKQKIIMECANVQIYTNINYQIVIPNVKHVKMIHQIVQAVMNQIIELKIPLATVKMDSMNKIQMVHANVMSLYLTKFCIFL